ncbi:thymidylate synthase [Geovibrio ferrireducens]|uniref:thymidylate synthase n=1 Tax=Geovibrio ferrireducens TaxID=46201 RepID=UPI002245947A|nr:thymidylate synthase [Geovibrio ferrireducens]
MQNSFSDNDANRVWQEAASLFFHGCGKPQGSRIGDTIELQHVSFNINNPRQRWIYARQPAVNPAFAIVELFVIMSGSNEAKVLNYWNPALPKYSGNSDEYYGAYGFRLRKQFGFDQIERAYHVLLNNPDSRQVVLQIWDPRTDMPLSDGQPRSEDIPCNICSMLKVRDGKLDWLQIMRSNDFYRGTPYNIVQFTSIQEILAGWLDLEPGKYCLVCDSLHIYKKDLQEIVFSQNELSEYVENTDSLSISKNSWDSVLKNVIDNLNLMINPEFKRNQLKKVYNSQSLPYGYKNLLCIVAADCARRHGWLAEMDDAVLSCSNNLLKKMWNNWYIRNIQK